MTKKSKNNQHKLPIEKSPAGFERIKRKAETYLNDTAKATELLRKAVEKAAKRKGALEGVWHDLLDLFRLLRAWIEGEYQGVSWQTMLLVTTSILYFVIPLDVVPDFIAMFGFLDDVAIIGFVLRQVRNELDEFLDWEKKLIEDQTDPEDQVDEKP